MSGEAAGAGGRARPGAAASFLAAVAVAALAAVLRPLYAPSTIALDAADAPASPAPRASRSASPASAGVARFHLRALGPRRALVLAEGQPVGELELREDGGVGGTAVTAAAGRARFLMLRQVEVTYERGLPRELAMGLQAVLFHGGAVQSRVVHPE